VDVRNWACRELDIGRIPLIDTLGSWRIYIVGWRLLNYKVLPSVIPPRNGDFTLIAIVKGRSRKGYLAC
jgi:hypothetical protein